MIINLILIGIAFLILLLALINPRIKNLKFLNWVEIELLPIPQNKYAVRTKKKIGIVISQDSNIYKIHIPFTIKCDERTSLNNVQLFISGLGWFVYRHAIDTKNDMRIPIKEDDDLLEKNIIHTRHYEFEPKEGWNPLEIKLKEYKSLLKVNFVDKTIKHKFTFQVRKQNLQAIDNIKNSKIIPYVIEVPIIKN